MYFLTAVAVLSSLSTSALAVDSEAQGTENREEIEPESANAFLSCKKAPCSPNTSASFIKNLVSFPGKCYTMSKNSGREPEGS